MHFCTVNKAKYKIAPTSNEGYTNIVLEEKYDFPNNQLRNLKIFPHIRRVVILSVK